MKNVVAKEALGYIFIDKKFSSDEIKSVKVSL
jgi:hypothetical protein